jgi:hypothetical protein
MGLAVQSSFPRYKASGVRAGPSIAKAPDALRGEKHYNAKAKQKDIDEMRADREAGMTVDALFLKYHARCGLSYQAIRNILAGRAWK